MGDAEGALEQYTTFVEAAEQNKIPRRAYAEVLENIGACHLKLGDRASAVRSLERAIAARDTPNARITLAIAFIQSGRLDDAWVHAAAARAADDADARTRELADRILADVDARRQAGS